MTDDDEFPEAYGTVAADALRSHAKVFGMLGWKAAQHSAVRAAERVEERVGALRGSAERMSHEVALEVLARLAAEKPSGG